MKRFLGLVPLAGRESIAADTVILTFDLELEIPVQAGQFAMLHPLTGCLLPRPFSILSHGDGKLEFLVKSVGKGSAALCGLKPGDEARILAPLGRGFSVADFQGKTPILVAGGVGIAPIHYLAAELHRADIVPLCLMGARTPGDLPSSLLQRKPMDWQIWLEEDSPDPTREGRVTQGLIQMLEQTDNGAVACCGPLPMMEAVWKICRERSIPLWLSLEEHMACGTGTCRGCVFPLEGQQVCSVCQDGPVFESTQLGEFSGEMSP